MYALRLFFAFVCYLRLDDRLDRVAHVELCLIVFYHLLAVFVRLPIPRPTNLPPGLDRDSSSAYSELLNICLNWLFDRNLRSINVSFSGHSHRNVLSRAEFEADESEKDSLSLVKEVGRRRDRPRCSNCSLAVKQLPAACFQTPA